MRKKNIILIIILGFFLRLINLNQSFWLDEAAQVIESVRPLSQQFDLAADFHPPLFHLLLHFWMLIGKSEIWIRLLSVLLAIGTIFFLYKIASNLFKKECAFITSFFLAISPYHLWYSQEARPYMLSVFATLLSTYLLLEKRWILYTLSLILTLYSSYFASFLIFGQAVYLYFLEKKYFPKFLKSLVVAYILFAIWLPSFWHQFNVGTKGVFTGWTEVVSVPTFKAIPLTFAKFIYGRGSVENNYLYGLVIFPSFLAFIFGCWKSLKIKSGKIILILFWIPFFISIIVSFFIPVVAPQRLIFLLPFFYLIITTGILSLKGFFRWLTIIVLFFISMAGVLQYWFNPYVQREQWREAVNFVEEDSDDRSIALFVFPSPFASYTWYSKGKIEALGIAPKFILSDDDLDGLERKIRDKNRVYLFQYLTGLTDPKGKARHFLESTGYKELPTKDFQGVGFIYVYENRN